jgi:hypothetical protein
MKQDAAFLNRFPTKLDWVYDEALEVAICGNPEWAKRVQYFRKKCKEKVIKHVLSPRQSIDGAKLLAQGIPRDVVEQLTIRAGLSDTQWSAIQ